MKLNKKQTQAVNKAVELPFSIINGGAGTGKTTIIKQIYEAVGGRQIRLCAPTGKAAARLREASDLPARTIHSLLKFDGVNFFEKSLAGSVVIVDESSMLDSWLLASLIATKPDKIILVGDEAQLPPIGPGAPFHDLVRVCPKNVTTLDKCYRSSEAIFKAATKIRKLEQPESSEKTANEQWAVKHTGSAEKTEAEILRCVRTGLINFKKDVILVTRNGNEDQACTVKSLNKKIAEILRPRPDNKKWIIGDRITCLKNFREFDVWNGTTGTIQAIDEEENLWVHGDMPFCGENGEMLNEIMWNKDVVKQCQLGYVFTIHKSQGSQYRNVIFACLAKDSYMMLSNSLIYTAITRAKKICYVVGDVGSFRTGIMRKKQKNTIIGILAKEI